MKRVILIRHGATAGNLERRYIGRTDEPLCEEGIRQITALQEKQLCARRVFVSPMLRTRQTAELLFPQQEHILVPDLRETDFGAFEGKTAAELSDDPAYQNWVDGWCRGPIPGGESKAEVSARCCAAFCEAIQQVEEGECAAFVIHGGVIMALTERFAADDGDFYAYHIGNGGYLLCEWEKERLCVLEKG